MTLGSCILLSRSSFENEYQIIIRLKQDLKNFSMIKKNPVLWELRHNQGQGVITFRCHESVTSLVQRWQKIYENLIFTEENCPISPVTHCYQITSSRQLDLSGWFFSHKIGYCWLLGWFFSPAANFPTLQQEFFHIWQSTQVVSK